MNAVTRQLLVYGLVGFGSNLLIYGLYLTLVAGGLGYLQSMTVGYAAGLLLAFFLNRQWTFASNRTVGPMLVRYSIAHLGCYTCNLLGLEVLVGRMGVDHRLAQAALIVAIGALLFVLMKFWVFSSKT